MPDNCDTVLRTIQVGTELTGDVNKALLWYRTEHLAAFGSKTAEQLVSEGHSDDALRYVSSLEVGATG